LAAFAPALESDPVAAIGSAIHQFDHCVVQVIGRWRSTDDLHQRSLGSVGVAETEQTDPKVLEGAQTGCFVIVDLNASPQMRDCFARLAAVE